MLNLSIMPMDTDHIDEVCDDIIEEEKSGAFTHAMMIMYFTPEGTPPVEKAKIQCEEFDKFRNRLDKAGAKYGVLVQSTMGHIVVPNTPHPFQATVALPTGNPRITTCCPLDEGFRTYMKAQMRELARHKPSLVMIDDDVGMLYRDIKGCACPLHMAEFNRRAGTSMSREELYQHTQGKSELDKKYTDIYVSTVKDSLVDFVKAMREGLDEVDPTIQGIVSGIYTSTFCEFSDETAVAFAGKGNPRIMRLNGGPYSNSMANGGARFFTSNMYRAAILRENVNDKVDIFLAETDTCPQNRYSTSAALLHAHFTGAILEGATGAKHWITRLSAHEPASGRAYRKKLAKYHRFYEKLTEYYRQLKPFGCRIPLTLEQDYGFVESKKGINNSPWSSCVLERMGLPLYFGNDGDGAVFLDDISVKRFCDEQIKDFLKGTLILSGGAAKNLVDRGFIDYIGVEVNEWQGKNVSAEIIDGKRVSTQVDKNELVIKRSGVKTLSHAIHGGRFDKAEKLFPAVTYYEHSLGGCTVVFCGTPDTPFKYFSAFSFLNETRKQQFVDILGSRGHLPVYYVGDEEVYLRAGRLENGEIFSAVFNLGLDEIEEVTLNVNTPFTGIEKLDADGNRVECKFEVSKEKVTIKERLGVLEPMVFFIV